MSRVVLWSLSMCLLAPLVSGCQTTTARATANQAPPSTFWTAEGGSEAREVAATGADERSVRFASLRESDAGSNAFSRLLSGGEDRIPLPESDAGVMRQIDPPRVSSANSIGAF